MTIDGLPHVLAGITFSKQFPNPREPLRGTFVAEQVLATRGEVRWGLIAPAPWVPGWASAILQRPAVPATSTFEGLTVAHPSYAVLPRRLLYLSVAPSIAAASAETFGHTVEAVRAAFVHAHGIYPSGAAARRLCARAQLPLVVSVHGSDLYTNTVKPRWTAEVRRTLDAASAIVCVSSSLARDVVGLTGVDASKVVVVPNTYDTKLFRACARRPSETLRLVSVGRLVPEKGFDVLLDAVHALVAGGVRVIVTLVGSGREEAALRQQVARLGLEQHVRLAGTLSGSGLVEALCNADLFVSSSRREGFGVAILEALATGLPVVATDSGGPADLIGSDDGVLVPVGDALALAEGIRRTAERLSAYDTEGIARRARNRFGPDIVGAELVRVYQRVVRNASGGSSR